MIKWFQFTDGTRYCLARDIVQYARSKGYNPIMSTDNRVHPGTICNSAMRSVIKHPGLRRLYRITPDSVIQINSQSDINKQFFSDLSEFHGLSSTISKGHLDLYSYDACRALLSMLLGNYDTNLSFSQGAIYTIPYPVEKVCKSMELKKLRPKASLFK